MSNFTNIVNLRLKPYYSKWLMIFMFILFAGVAYYFYTRIYMKKWGKTNNDNKFNDVANSGEANDEIRLYLVSVDWCPYCKKAQGPWADFVNQYDKKVVNGHIVNCINIKEGDDMFSGFCNEHNITKYPTVLILCGDNKYDFDSAVTFNSLQQFVEFVANKEKQS